MARRIIEKFANYDDFWNEYRSNFIDDNIDPVARAAHTKVKKTKKKFLSPVINCWSCQLSNGDFYQGNTKKELINLFIKFSQSKSKRYLLYAHNGNSYDIFFLVSSFVKLLTPEEKPKFKPKCNVRTWQEIRWRNIRFLDSWLLLRVKLEKVMNEEEKERKQLVSFPNGKANYNWELAHKFQLKKEAQILAEYNKSDTLALYRVLAEHWQKYPEAQGRITISGLSFYLWKKENPEQFKKLNNLAKPWADELRQFCEQSYFAALEANLNENSYHGQVYKYDMNAFYAHLMRTNEFPLGRPRFTRKVRQEFNPHKEIGFFEVEFENLQIKDQEGWIPFLTLRDPQFKTEFSYFRTYRGVLPTPLLELVLQAYSFTDFRILRKCLFLTRESDFFVNFINKYSAKKEQAKAKQGELEVAKGHDRWCKLCDDSLGYIAIKNILTNLYGKFGQHVFRANLEFVPVKNKSSSSATYWDNNNNLWQFRLNHEEESRSQGFNYMPISAFVTAYARIFMVKTIKEKGKHNFLYLAKDCLVSKIPFEPSEIDPIKTGYWKLEMTAEEWTSHSIKGYRFGDKKIMKGLKREEAEQLDYQQLQTQPMKVASQVSFKTNNGVVIIQKDKIFRPSIDNLKAQLINGHWTPRQFEQD
jgi:hypothetical protein